MVKTQRKKKRKEKASKTKSWNRKLCGIYIETVKSRSRLRFYLLETKQLIKPSRVSWFSNQSCCFRWRILRGFQVGFCVERPWQLGRDPFVIVQSWLYAVIEGFLRNILLGFGDLHLWCNFGLLGLDPVSFWWFEGEQWGCCWCCLWCFGLVGKLRGLGGESMAAEWGRIREATFVWCLSHARLCRTGSDLVFVHARMCKYKEVVGMWIGKV